MIYLLRIMGLRKINKSKSISIDVNAIADVIGNAVVECYGIIGLAQLDNKGNVNLLEEKNSYSKGIECSVDKKGDYEIRISLVVAYGTKVTEVIHEVRSKVKYVAKQIFDIDFKRINIFVEGIKEIN